MKPLVFKDVYKPYIWGGRNLEKFGKSLPEGIVAESWEISAHPDGMGIVAEGPEMGKTLAQLVTEYGSSLMGTCLAQWATERFPLLVKLIDANDRLSVQVHPDDAYAKEHENGSFGKNEMWVILDAEPGAELIFDIRPGVTRERFERAVLENDVEACLKHVPVKKGDALYIPAGKIHAIGKGIVIAEIQQNSNATYRVYDYGRRDAEGNTRPLHIEKSLDVTDFSGNGPALVPQHISENVPGGVRKVLAASPWFVVEQVTVSGTMNIVSDGSRFHAWTMVSGQGFLRSSGEQQEFTTGHSVLMPADAGAYSWEGDSTLLLAYMPTQKETAEMTKLSNIEERMRYSLMKADFFV